MTATLDDEITVSDHFCGAGGSSQGAHAAGLRVDRAFNHWPLAIESHAANFPTTDHVIADLSITDPSKYSRTRLAWFSPECTFHSQGRGDGRQIDREPDLFGEVLPDEAAERSRSTMSDVYRFTAYHRYEAVFVENVVEVVKWREFPRWMREMKLLGYRVQIVCLNSMHAQAVGTPLAPQSRDRIYFVFTRLDVPVPDVTPTPLAWCPICALDVPAIQSWKNGRTVGRYRAQYVYRCPRQECRYSIVEPYAAPAAAAIDWSMPGQRIGDRAKPLKPKTLARIEAGLRKFGRPMTFEAAGNTYVRTDPDGRARYARAWPVDQPTATLTTTATRALVVPPDEQPCECLAHPSAEGPHHSRFCSMHLDPDALVVPVEGRNGKDAASVQDPLRTQTTRAESALLVPYYSRGAARPASEPMGTVTTVDRQALVAPADAFLMRHYTPRGDLAQMATSVQDPAPTQTASFIPWLVVPSGGTWNDQAQHADQPMRTRTARETDGVAFISTARGWGQPGADERYTRSTDEPLSTVVAGGNHHMLVRHNGEGGSGWQCTPTSEPMRTLTAAAHQSLVSIEDAINDCTFRMLEPHEVQAAMAFYPTYTVLGNRRERVRQLGNAVTPPAAEFLFRRVAEALSRTAAAA